jgi:CubicO group peptidase (beta-lactamase class C family)
MLIRDLLRPTRPLNSESEPDKAVSQVLRIVLEKITGLPLDELIRAEVFKPLGMGSSHVSLTPAEREHCMTSLGMQHWIEGGRFSPVVGMGTSIQEGVNASTLGLGPLHDLGLFYEGLLQAWRDSPTALLTRSTLNDLLIPLRDLDTSSRVRAIPLYGFGFQRDMRNTICCGRHCSSSSFGYCGMVRGEVALVAFADPDHELVVAVMLNGVEKRVGLRYRGIVTALYEELGLCQS